MDVTKHSAVKGIPVIILPSLFFFIGLHQREPGKETEGNKGTGRVIKGKRCVCDLPCVAMRATICSVPANGDFSSNPGEKLFKILFPLTG